MPVDLRQTMRELSARVRPWHFMVPYVARGGNFLYFWLWADAARRAGHRAEVLFRPAMREWIEVFPALAEITYDGTERRWPLRVWQQTQRFGVDFTANQLDTFVRERLLSSPQFMDRVIAWEDVLDARTVVINVRRGDYYSVPEYNVRFGFDIASYVSSALPTVAQEGGQVLFISDDPAWCARVLGPRLGPNLMVRPWPRTTFLDDFAALAASRRLVLTNSTFSYWGGYVAACVNAEVQVVAPALHERGATSWRAVQHAPWWRVVEDPVGGDWQATESRFGNADV